MTKHKPQTLIESTEVLVAAIGNLIESIDQGDLMVDTDKKIMTVALTSFVAQSIAKFIRGQEEHGGSLIKNTHLSKAMNEEIIDLFWYLSYKMKQEEQQSIQNN